MQCVPRDYLVDHHTAFAPAVAYYAAIHELFGYFTIYGEQIRERHHGYDDRRWIRGLVKVTADVGFFRRPGMRIEHAPSFSDIWPLITADLVADYCLADDLLRSLYFEYLLYDYQKTFAAAPKTPHTVQRRLKEISSARRDFRLQKYRYLRVAYHGHVPRKVQNKFQVEVCGHTFMGGIDLLAVYSGMPIVLEEHPRRNTADNESLSKLCRKHESLFAFCDEAIASLSG